MLGFVTLEIIGTGGGGGSDFAYVVPRKRPWGQGLAENAI